ncbi:MAG TPA: NAD+ synthase [Bacillota bacterium]|jgi:NAD+ synthase (glutamine-hydrolysing)|nr:NAD+ synthase [Bacillota bacterium]
MKIAMAQLNPVVGAVEYNMNKAMDTLEKLAKEQPDLVVFPELFLVGYPPRDLLERTYFIHDAEMALERLTEYSKKYPETGIIMGAPVSSGCEIGRGLLNAAVLIHNGRVIFVQGKTLLPTYDVFDENRYFDPAETVKVISFKGETLAISICEDAWNEPELWPQGSIYEKDPIANLAEQGATVMINISASPFVIHKGELRLQLIQNHARRHHLPFLYINQVGGNDELVFDGGSFAVDQYGTPIVIAPTFDESLTIFETDGKGDPALVLAQDPIDSVNRALVLGVRDYMHKTGFSKAVVGLSGGIDSALTCCLAVEAVGRENVLGISMPSPYSSTGSVEDSRRLAENLGIDFRVIGITKVYESYLETLKEPFAGMAPGVTEENIQARIRGNILMAFSNKMGYLLLSTGNKSEMAVGYCTLYGDMSGGLSVLSDLPKTMVYEVSRNINREREVIPQAIIEKAPSAELRPDQRDQDTLPPYSILDAILNGYIEEGLSAEELVAEGLDRETVEWVIRAINRNEYKRRQAAPGLKVTSKAFGVGRRMPIAAKY